MFYGVVTIVVIKFLLYNDNIIFNLTTIGAIKLMSDNFSADDSAALDRNVFLSGFLNGDFPVNKFFESIGEGIVIVNAGGRIILKNERLNKLFGYNGDELIGRDISVLIPERYHSAHAGYIKNYISEPRVRQMGSGVELSAKRSDGTEFPVENSLCFLNTGKKMYMMAFVTDISARKKAEDELRTRNEELDAFAHTVAHDLKSTLFSLIGFSDLLLSNPEYAEEQRIEYLYYISKSGKKMAEVIKELLLFAGAGKEEVVPAVLDMKLIVSEALARLKQQVSESSADVEIKGDFPAAIGYPQWIEEVWYNFISNAIKYGGSPPKITIGSALCDNGLVKFWISDNGGGLNESVLEKVFKSSSPVKFHSENGTGLGLSIVQRIIEKLNGRVSVESIAGSGCTFSFYLPKQTV